MENGPETGGQVKRNRFGPKKVFLSRLSGDSESSSGSTLDRYNQSQYQQSFDEPSSIDGQAHVFSGKDIPLKNSVEDQYYSAVKTQFTDKNSAVQAGNQLRKSIDDDFSDGREKMTARGHSNVNQNFARQNSGAKNQTLNRNEQTSRKLGIMHQNLCTKNQNGDDQNKSSLDFLAVPSHQRVDSLSAISLPDELRFSFSEIEDGSIQLDDLDLTCSPSATGSSSGNLATIEVEKSGAQDSDLQRVASAISSTSENKTSGKQITEMSRLSEEFMTSQRQPSSKLQKDVKSENQDEASITWDDIVTWGVNAHQVSSTVSHGNEPQGKKRTVSQRRSSKNKHMENVMCQVCGDTAAGFYCGAFICEACKKFYMRAYKQDKLKYVCLRDKKCVITKESRVQCQYCRFQKCISLNMYIPKQGEGETNKEMQMSEIPCRVCSAPSSGFHFGAITCEGCKGFFRRMAKEREPEKYQCNKKGNCEINMVTRNLCKACRYRSCVRAGMSVEGSRIGRQPNSVKHAISMELKHGKNELAPDIKIKDEPIDNSPGPDFLTDSARSNDFSFWNQDSNSSMNEPLITTCSPGVTPLATPTTTEESQSNLNNFTWPHIDSDLNKTPKNTIASPTSVPASNPVITSFENSPAPMNFQQPARLSVPGRDMGRPAGLLGGRQASLTNVPYSTPPPRGPATASAGSSVVFTPSPVTQFLSTTPKSEIQSPTSRESNSQFRFRVPAPLSVPNASMGYQSGSPLSTQHSPTSTTSPTRGHPCPSQSQEVCIGNMKLSMKEFISKIIEAGKCLQLLNYRVFDTDVSPGTSMNVDDIKALFKSKYMDPKAGNHITSKVDMNMFSTRETTWNYMMTNFHHNTYITIRFAKLVPGFKTLSLNDQVKLIQSSIYPIELLNMSKVFDPTTKKYNYFTYTKEEENIMMEQFPMLRVFQEHFLHIGEMVTSLQFTDEEFAIMSALLLFPAEIHGLENPKAVEQLQNQITAALQAYEESRFADGMTRFGILLVRVAELVQCLLQHNLAIGLLLTHNPTIKVPQLFHELIIESIKEGQKL